MTVNMKNVKQAMKHFYLEADEVDFYKDLYRAMYTLHCAGLISSEEMIKISDYDSALFDKKNEE